MVKIIRSAMRIFVLTAILLLLGLTFSVCAQSSSSTELKSYFYSYTGKPVECKTPYIVEKVLTGTSLGCGDFLSPSDVFAAPDGSIYIADSKNNRIVKLNCDLQFEKVIDHFGDGNSFNNPTGLFVAHDDSLYIADSDNGRIVHLAADGSLIGIISAPQSELLKDDFEFKPLKLVVNPFGRIYVVAANVNDGIMEFDAEGNFEGFLAAGKVNPNPWLLFWKRFSTDAQRERMQSTVPVEYNNIAIDDEGFIFATNQVIDTNLILEQIKNRKSSEGGAVVRRLNNAGMNILKDNGYFPPVGDVYYPSEDLPISYSGPSQIIDVSCGEYGTYSLLDNNRKRIFTYDNEGNLLFVFGGPGFQNGGFVTPVSLVHTENRILVLDSNTNSLVVFSITSFGRNILDAIAAYQNGEYTAAEELWEEVLHHNSDYELAYIGMGKSEFRKENYKESMRLFRLGNNRDWYSRAYKEYRKLLIESWFPLFASFVLLILVILTGRAVYKWIVRVRKDGLQT